ncbi:MAG TPA: DinB family protein [Pyrinomonadaceae bacterium]|jgi:uncharacterized damage-inducible protein DinB|nr:DinB family protein [Pyrinomonadaceae bacterium]
MSVRTLNSVAGFSREVGFYFSGMEEVREQLRKAVTGMSEEEISRPAIPDAHSIGALVLHIGEAEWYWMQYVLSGRQVTDEIRNSPYWDVLKDPISFAQRNFSADFCLEEIKKIRQQTAETLASFNDTQLDRVFSFTRGDETVDLTLRWILHHLIDHEAQHKGQILMLKRLSGRV